MDLADVWVKNHARIVHLAYSQYITSSDHSADYTRCCGQPFFYEWRLAVGVHGQKFKK